MSWYDEMVAARRSKSLTTGNVRCRVAAVHEVLGSPALANHLNESSRNLDFTVVIIQHQNFENGTKQSCIYNDTVIGSCVHDLSTGATFNDL